MGEETLFELPAIEERPGACTNGSWGGTGGPSDAASA